MNNKYNWTKLVIITLLCSVSMVLHAARFEQADKNQPTAISGTGGLSISGTGGIATRAFTGIWNQPAHSSQSTVIQMVDNGTGGLNAIIYWLAFDKNAIPFWFFAQGPVTTNRIDLTIFVATIPATVPPTFFLSSLESLTFVKSAEAVQTDSNLQIWGTGSIVFDNCEEGTFSGLDSISGTGGFEFGIKKIFSVAGTVCAGGTSDNINPSDPPVDIKSFFTPTTVGAGSSGKAKFEILSGRTKFEVEVEDLPIGEYELSVDGVKQGSIQVLSSTDGTEGELEFRSPVEAGKVLLIFDPRGKLVEVSNSASTVVLAQTFPLESSTTDADPGGIGGGSEIEIRVDLTNAGIYPAGDAKAEFEHRPNRSEFSVELEDIPVGDYDLFVGSVLRGTISVVDVTGGTEGEIEFRSPLEAGKVLLDFDPRNQLIEVMEGTTLLFSSDLVLGGGISDGTTNIELAFDLQNSGVDGGASGTLDYEKNGGETRIEVKIEDLSKDGSYDVFFNDILKGAITVNDGKGEWKFRSPQDGSVDPFFGFDPFGATVSIRLNGVEILFINIP